MLRKGSHLGRLPYPTSRAAEDVINAVASRATWALETLYQCYCRMLYTLAYQMVADHQLTEDLDQDTFVTIWQQALFSALQAETVRYPCTGYVRRVTHDERASAVG
jgi:DNA-directed RNA polymerase specialized sigma24 family protein